jgi:hypothetical protein
MNDNKKEIEGLERSIKDIKYILSNINESTDYIVRECLMKKEVIDKTKENASNLIDFLSDKTENMGELVASIGFAHEGALKSLSNMLLTRLLIIKKHSYDEIQHLSAKEEFDCIRSTEGKTN